MRDTKTQTSYVTINGRRVNHRSGEALDGLGPRPGAKLSSSNNLLDLSPNKQPQPVVKQPVAGGGIDAIKPAKPPKTLPKTVRNPIAAPEPAPNYQPKPATENKPKVNLSEHKLPLAASQTHHRAQRAQQHPRSHMIHKPGRKPNQVQQLGTEPERAPLTTTTAKIPSVIIQEPVQERAEANTQDQQSRPLSATVKALLRTRRSVAVSATALSMLLVVGYAAYLNTPNISMRVAAARAGIRAEMPDYQPSGFARSGPIEYAPGRVVVTFRSNTDDRTYRLVQEESKLDASSLETVVARNSNQNYSVIERNGLNIYVYDGANATWVNGGILYTVDGQSLLTNDQLAAIAASF